MEAKATVTLEIDTARNAFRLNFNGPLWLISLGTVGATAGRFVLETPQNGRRLGALLGRRHDRDELLRARAVRHLPVRQGHAADQPHGRDADRDADAAGPRRGRRGPQPHLHAAPVLVRPRGRRPAQAAPAGPGRRPARRAGRLLDQHQPGEVRALRHRLAVLRLRRRAAQLRRGHRPADHPDRRHARPQRGRRGHAHRQPLRRHRPAEHRLAVLGRRLGQGDVQHDPPGPDVHRSRRTSCRCSSRATRPRSPSSPRRPASTASATRTRLPAARSTSRPPSRPRSRSAASSRSIGFIGIEAAGSGTDARLEVTGAVSTTIAYIGSLTGTLNLNIYAGATKTGVVGRIFLARSDAGSIPGVSLTGQFLLEINTFASEQTIETFKIKKRTVPTASSSSTASTWTRRTG